jgi:RimJ/RimL family protein N-acetyltransferase
LASLGDALVFEHLQKCDAERVCKAWGSRPENFTYLTAPVLSSTTLAQDYINKTLTNTESLVFHILVGNQTVGLVRAIVEGHRAQVGYVIDQEFWGKGIATPAVKFVTQRLNG